MTLRVLSYNILVGGENRLPLIANSIQTPTLRIDYIFASPNLIKHLYACDVVMGGDAEKASDHFPIGAEFR
ncbi:MAG: endonuclease/exonuclease/phosphatase family protein [Ktedonobacteraceae bacterium]